MQIIDISVPLSETTPVWPGDTRIQLKTITSRDQGNEYHVSQFTFSSHNGTHIDAPFHFLNAGTKLPEIPVSRFLIRTNVIEYSNAGHITEKFIHSLRLEGAESLLFKTQNSSWLEKSEEDFHENFIALQPCAARILVELGIRLVGIDYFSIEPFDSETHQVHKILLNNNIIILEGINLSSIRPGEYLLVCMPIKINSPDGAPVRAVLLDGIDKELFLGRNNA